MLLALSAQLGAGLEVERSTVDAGSSELLNAIDATLPGTTITIKSGDSVYGLARTIYPHNERAVRDLAQAILLTNPTLFPNGRGRPLQVGERLTIPDLRNVQRIVAAATLRNSGRGTQLAPGSKTAQMQDRPAAGRIAPAPPLPAARQAGGAAKHDNGKPVVANSGKTVLPRPRRSTRHLVVANGKLKLKLATSLDISRSRGVTEEKREALRRHTQAPTRPDSAAQAIAPASALVLRVDRIREMQDDLNARLARLEAAAAGVRQALIEAQARERDRPPSAQPSPPAQPQPSAIRQPMPALSEQSVTSKWRWGVIGTLLVALAIGAFFIGRRFQKRRALTKQSSRIEAMLEEARSAATPLLGSDPVLPTSGTVLGETAAVRPASETASADIKDNEHAQPEPGIGTETWLDTPSAEHPPQAPPQPVSPAARASMPDEPSSQLRLEMDEALDSTRSMFSDVDRFITLGRIENAISLLEFQIKRTPTDRPAWIKLMAVYRQQGMDDDFDRTYAGFREQFGDSLT